MKQRSPVSVGLETLFRRPSLGLAEISWRWSFGAASILLLAFAVIEYLDSLPVSTSDRLLLRSMQPALIVQALAHIVRGSAPQVIAVFLLIALALAAAWVVLASVGRAVTLKALLNFFENEVALQTSEANELSGKLSCFQSLVALNILRVAILLAAAIACAGATLLVARWTPPEGPAIAAAFQLSQALIMLIWMAWFAINWFLSLATVLVVVQAQDTLSAIRAAADLCIERASALTVASLAFGAAHFIAAIVASFAGMFVLALLGRIPNMLAFAAVSAITLMYFAVANCFYAGRLAAYVAVIARPPELAPRESVAAFDDDDRILSDMPFVPAGN
ncbi:MAG: hypothetical protein ABJA69_11455 [Acidobacteriaceae bacterium]